MKITIEFIPHLDQRYNTCGDWSFAPDGDLSIKVSILQDTGIAGSYLIAIHELVEALLCDHHGVDTSAVDAFDKAYDMTSDIEPGDHPGAPYHEEHCIATGVERILAPAFGVWWLPYEDELAELTEQYELRENDRLKHE
jgi:hypothetical protein